MPDTASPNDIAMQSYYAARAPEYDRVYLKPERQANLRRLEQWLPPLFTGRRVLEVACGTGYWTQFIAPVAAAMVALDTSAQTMAIAAQRVPAGRVEFLVGDAYALPTDRGVFDAAFAGFWLSHVPRQRQREFLAGLGAALAPGATVVLIDNRFVAGSNQPIVEQDAERNTWQARSLDDGSTHRVLKNFPTEAELRASVEGLGEQVEYLACEYYWALRYQVRTV
ncbi:MAG TPA: methyltransferase domain-containing protein [Ideonella sp.]|nr:methyltransferase domain-containing protein [Ideonella sp.]